MAVCSQTEGFQSPTDTASLYEFPETIHPSLPKNKLIRIADVATGTGIWIDESAKAMSSMPTHNRKPQKYDGFEFQMVFS
ncbi:hypothetical protein BDZ45DRAFT_743165 [Acephala macrosclerotiorum]|nr:hypothetical protein BDZ45DRAFT_743165 [Acephala macrosclerotiorum]